MVEGERAAKLLRIDATGVPIYVQIRDQVMHLIGTGALEPGQQTCCVWISTRFGTRTTSWRAPASSM
jgi:sugar (pentulose or hexulose) kinase